VSVETEANGDLKITYERDSSLVGLLGLSCRYFCPVPHRTIFHFVCNPTSWAGSRAGSPVSECVSLAPTKDRIL